MKKHLLIYIFIFPFLIFGQTNVLQETPKDSLKNPDKISDIAKVLKDYEITRKMDSVWLAAKYNSPLYDSLAFVIPNAELLPFVPDSLFTSKLKNRLDSLHHNSPFNIAYNPVLERVIKTYLKKRQKHLMNLMTKAKYYFPLFEEQLDKYDIPLEMKYLAIVESALRPNARSGAGAKGLWQFMYSTGKMFDLKVSSYVDERADPLKSTEAACKYLSSLYKTFDDWDLALAAYNSGPGNVTKAIRRSGGYKNYWNIRPYLPRETQGYVPAFYATMYIFEYAKEHNLRPNAFSISYFETDTIRVKRQLTFAQINKVLNTDNTLLWQLNPQYKLGIIPYLKGRHYALRLPYDLAGVFVTNEDSIYAYAAADAAAREKPLPRYFELNNRIRYRVKNGDYLGKIANRHGVSVRKLKQWNRLKSNNLRIGQRLTIYPRRFPPAAKKRTKKSLPKGKYSIYVVKKGDSLWSIAQKYPKISTQQIKDWNNIWNSRQLKPGTKLKIFKS
ncbi:MAG: LysM peptidoglycan-binding domain-containing protein [Flavobacteriaceae bacterium]|nr:LysM peptidoglycan-binding domain-containing protein [Flavobacteriaceae bacterium]